MSRSWNEQELRAASAAMKAAGHMSYEEFCEELERQNSFEKDYQAEQENLKACRPIYLNLSEFPNSC